MLGKSLVPSLLAKTNTRNAINGRMQRQVQQKKRPEEINLHLRPREEIYIPFS